MQRSYTPVMVMFSHLGLAKLGIILFGIGALLFGGLTLQKSTKKIATNPSPTHVPSPQPSPTSQQTSPHNSSAINEFLYPNAKTITNSAGTTTLETTDQPAVITNWYKNQLHQQSFTTTTVIQTNTNNIIENKLVGSKDDQTIAIAISKNPSDEMTHIEVSKN